MRILIKGGVWKNTEDEILKAAVMKYGKNQWARVASLMNRKSAKQCKARWYEWLDPSIKKTEWNKEEEEKLLHLAKLMPNQWRTIAPIVGRTAGQCMEHYERLLDQAQENAPEEGAEDPRKLRPGEIDPTPETKPARPDPIDMDEDEKEMLSEARARLANTKGKKAKRKARERQMEDSRRLASLQKRRELKAAGIESKLNGLKKRKYIDYAREIPFQKVPPAGFYATMDEDVDAKKQKLDPTLHGMELSKMEGRHVKEEEDRLRAKDKKALKKLFKENAPLAITKVADANDPVALRKRGTLNLPAPQVTDAELEDIVKVGMSSLPQLTMGPPTGAPAATQALLGDYSHAYRATPTPMRTPMQENIIMQEARNLLALRDMTPFSEKQLSAAGLPELYEGTGFGGITPRAAKLATPNTLVSYGNNGGATPSTNALVPATPNSHTTSKTGSKSAGQTQMRIRDHFGLNDAANSSAHDDAFSADPEDSSSVALTLSSRGAGGGQLVLRDADRERQLKNILAQQLSSLPEPEYTYEVSLPAGADDLLDQAEEDGQGEAAVEDATEAMERIQRLEKEALEREFNRRSEVLKRGLPRPLGSVLSKAHWRDQIVDSANYPFLSGQGEQPAYSLSEASKLVNAEMLSLILRDEFKFPNDRRGKNVTRVQEIELEDHPDEYIGNAKSAISAELDTMLTGPQGEQMKYTQENFSSLWEEAYKGVAFLPYDESSGKVGGAVVPLSNKADTLVALRAQHAVLKSHVDRLAKKASKLHNKLQVTTQGYGVRAKQLEADLLVAFDQWKRAEVDLTCYKRQQDQERRALKQRLAIRRQELREVEQKEQLAQSKYADILRFSKSVASNN